MTVQVCAKRRALTAIDANKPHNVPVGEKELKSKNDRAAPTQTKKVSRSPTPKPCEPKVKTLAQVERKEKIAEEIKAAFEAVATTRVSEDRTGLSDLGIQEWSFDDFEYVGKLGSGGAANVFHAKEKQSGHAVALKIQDADDEDIFEEIDIHDGLNHRSIVKMIDYFFSGVPFGPKNDTTTSESPDRYVCIILELCQEGSLYDMIRSAPENRLCEKQAAAYFRSALLALEYLHDEETIIHCDCKTANFLVQGNEIKLADFGMAVKTDEKEVIGGSPVYMSPEHLLAWHEGSDNFDHRVDIYGLGIVLYEILVGEVPCDIVHDDDESTDCDPLLDDENGDSFLAGFDKLRLDDLSCAPPTADLENKEDRLKGDATTRPEWNFPHFVSDEAKDLILRLTEPCPEARISLSEARGHAWLQKQNINTD